MKPVANGRSLTVAPPSLQFLERRRCADPARTKGGNRCERVRTSPLRGSGAPRKGYTSDMSDVSKRVEAMQERLDEVQEEIDEARVDAQNIDPQRPKETFIETASEPSASDDPIASPD